MEKSYFHFQATESYQVDTMPNWKFNPPVQMDRGRKYRFVRAEGLLQVQRRLFFMRWWSTVARAEPR